MMKTLLRLACLVPLALVLVPSAARAVPQTVDLNLTVSGPTYSSPINGAVTGILYGGTSTYTAHVTSLAGGSGPLPQFGLTWVLPDGLTYAGSSGQTCVQRKVGTPPVNVVPATFDCEVFTTINVGSGEVIPRPTFSVSRADLKALATQDAVTKLWPVTACPSNGTFNLPLGDTTVTALVRTGDTDTNPANNVVVHANPQLDNVDIASTFTGPASSSVGASVTFTATVKNLGPCTATNIEADTLVSGGLVFTSSTAPCEDFNPKSAVTGGSCVVATGAAGDLAMAPGDSRTWTVTYTVAPLPGTLTDTGDGNGIDTYSLDLDDPDYANNTPTTQTRVHESKSGCSSSGSGGLTSLLLIGLVLAFVARRRGYDLVGSLRRLARFAPLALLFMGVASAQSTGVITGVVTDGATGNPVVGAVVSATSPASGEKTTVTDAKGVFSIGGLPAGQYKLQAAMDGYKVEARSDLALGEAVTLRANLAIVPEAVQLEEVVVTGSRIKRKDLNTPAPVTLLSKESMVQSGKVGIGDFLQSLPEQGNAINTSVNNGGDGATRVSLRSLGTNRTLVLVNNRRMVAGGTGADGSPDLNGIPSAAIERIEVLKDGASAIYGSDAIGGVVNIITKRNWSGSEVTAYQGISGHSDAKVSDVSFTTGAAGEKGSILFSAGYFKQEPAWAGDRPFSAYQYFFDAGNGEYTGGSSRAPGGRVSRSGGGNALWGLLKGLTAGPGGTGYMIHDPSMGVGNAIYDACIASGFATNPADCKWRRMDLSGSVGSPIPPQGDLYNYAPLNYLQTPGERISAYANGDYKLGSNARAYFETSYVNRQSRQQLAPEPLIIGPGGVTDPGGNLVSISPYNQYNPFGKGISSASMRLTAFGPRTHKEDIDTFRLVGGVDGTLSDLFGPLKGWFWDASINYGRTYGTFVTGGSLISSRIASALGPSKDGVCYQTYSAETGQYSNPIAGCVPMDLFHGSASQTPEMASYLGYTGTSNGTNKLTTYQLNTSGELFRLLADRPIGLAVGVEYRDVAGSFINDPPTALFDSTNGGGHNTAGSYNAKEGYAELVVPVVSNMLAVEDLELSFAARVFDYSNFGSDSTYKAGGRWKPIKDVTLRGTYSTAFRAPNVGELFAGQFDNFPNVSDPCASAVPGTPLGNRCGIAAGNGDDSVQLKTREGGNPALKPETAKIYTAGVVFEPTVLPNFSATLDYYNVSIDKAITTIGAATVLNGCYSGNQPQYCSLINRDPLTNQINTIFDVNQNAGKEDVAGIDLALRYNQPTDAFGRFTFSFDGTWLQKHNLTLADGTVIKGKGNWDLNSNGQGGSNPEYRFNAGVVWGLSNFGAGATMRYVGSFKECGDGGGDFAGSGACYVDSTYQRVIKAYSMYNLFVSYQLQSVAGKTSLMVGVNNVFNAAPPKIYNSFASTTDQYTYDQIGRYYFGRLSHAF